MKTLLICKKTWVWLLIGLSQGVMGQVSSNAIKYQVSYDSNTLLYTVWVVPQYTTPNSNNTDVNEYGATAQVSLKVPKTFVPTNITDIHGTWEKSPIKLGDQSVFSSYGLDPDYVYYVIGKSPVETNYGSFSTGVAIKLFTFQGNSCYGSVSILTNNDPFVSAAMAASSLNVACSFNSRSGQASGGNVSIMEQFIGKQSPDAPGNTFQANITQSACNNNGTPTTVNKADDYFNVSVTAMNGNNGSTGSPTGLFEVVVNGTVMGASPYTTPLLISGKGGVFQANGSSSYTFLIRDKTNTTCSTTQTSTPMSACSTDCPIPLCPMISGIKH